MEIFLLASIVFLSILGISFSFVSLRLQLNHSKSLSSLIGVAPISPVPGEPVHFLALPFEVWAFAYYFSLIFISISTYFWGELFWVALFFIVFFGAVLSMYLISAQVMTKRGYYGLSLTSSLIPVMILGTLFLMAPVFSLTEGVRSMEEGLFVAIRTFSFMGLALAVLSFFTFLSFMDDMTISAREHKRLSLISDGTIIFLISLLVLGLGAFLVAGTVDEMQVISLAFSIILVSAICEFTKTARIRPALAFLSLKRNEHRFDEKDLLKRLAFGIEGITVTSWMFVVFLFFAPFGLLETFQVIGLYVLLVMVAFLLSQLITNR